MPMASAAARAARPQDVLRMERTPHHIERTDCSRPAGGAAQRAFTPARNGLSIGRNGQHRSAQAAIGCPNATTPATASSAQAMDAAVLCLVNEQRTKRGLPSLAQQSQLETVAQQWTDSMVSSGQFTHGLNFAGRITASG